MVGQHLGAVPREGASLEGAFLEAAFPILGELPGEQPRLPVALEGILGVGVLLVPGYEAGAGIYTG